MKITLAAATQMELSQFSAISFKNHSVEKLIHGVGLLSSVYEITHYLLLSKPDFIIQCGIAGAYNRDLKIGESVIIENEIIDSGVENKETIDDIFDLNFYKSDDFPFENKRLPCPFIKDIQTKFKKVNALTVQVCSGTETTINKRLQKYQADVESMEGAALHYVCLKNDIPFLQFKTISNYVEVRNKDNWDIDLALKNNSTDLINFIDEIL